MGNCKTEKLQTGKLKFPTTSSWTSLEDDCATAKTFRFSLTGQKRSANFDARMSRSRGRLFRILRIQKCPSSNFQQLTVSLPKKLPGRKTTLHESLLRMLLHGHRSLIMKVAWSPKPHTRQVNATRAAKRQISWTKSRRRGQSPLKSFVSCTVRIAWQAPPVPAREHPARLQSLLPTDRAPIHYLLAIRVSLDNIRPVRTTSNHSRC